MRSRLIVAVIIAVIPLTACSSGSSKTSSASATPTAPSTAPADTSAATEQIKKAYKDFFAGTTSFADKATLLEDGATFTAALNAAAKNPAAKLTQAVVTAVTFTAPDKASVKYNLLVGGTKVINGGDGLAVLQDNKWKVSKITFCQLQKIGSAGAAVPGCP